MHGRINIYEDEHYKFVDFSGILMDIRESFLEDILHLQKEHPLKITKAFNARYLKHATLAEILKSYVYVDQKRTNAIIIPKHIEFTSGGLISDDDIFISKCIGVIDRTKRDLPLAIKKVDCKFSEFGNYIHTGEGEEFLLQVECDREKLKNQVSSFQKFKKFAKKEGLIDITDNLIDKIEFKRLFMG